MYVARTIMAFVMALSLAMLPAAGLVPVGAKSSEAAATFEAPVSAEMAAVTDDCCPDHAKPCEQGSDRCASMASCAHQSFSISNVAVSQFVYPLVPGGRLFALVEPAIPLQTGSAPFRPPRV